jgi:hypothetical protein
MTDEGLVAFIQDVRLGEPNTNAELFDLLRRGAWIDESGASWSETSTICWRSRRPSERS